MLEFQYTKSFSPCLKMGLSHFRDGDGQHCPASKSLHCLKLPIRDAVYFPFSRVNLEMQLHQQPHIKPINSFPERYHRILVFGSRPGSTHDRRSYVRRGMVPVGAACAETGESLSPPTTFLFPPTISYSHPPSAKCGDLPLPNRCRQNGLGFV